VGHLGTTDAEPPGNVEPMLASADEGAKSGLLNLINDEASFFPVPKPGEPSSQT
jgi:hypothetical protein